MGIDIYMHWKGQTPQEKALQYVGFDATMGRYGYLREAYHGSPYATKYFVTEAFMDDGDCECDELDLDFKESIDVVTGQGRFKLPRASLAIDERCDYCQGVPFRSEVLLERLPHTLELAAERERTIYNRPFYDDVLQSYRDFVALAIDKEDKTGQPVRIYASY